MKKFIIVILPILFYACATTSEPDPIPKLYLSPASNNVLTGSDVEINIMIEENQVSIFGMSMQLTHNNNVLDFNDSSGFAKGSMFNQSAIGFAQKNNSTIHLSVSQINGQNSTSGSGTVGTLTFRAQAQGNSPISIQKDDLKFYNSNGNEINIPDLEIESATVFVQ